MHCFEDSIFLKLGWGAWWCVSQAHPFRNHLSSARPGTSWVQRRRTVGQARGRWESGVMAGLQVTLSSRPEVGFSISSITRVCFSQPLVLQVEFSWNWQNLCSTDSEGPPLPFFLSTQCLPPCLSRQEAAISPCVGGEGEQRQQARQEPAPAGSDCSGGRGVEHPPTPRLWPHQMPLRSSPASPGSLPG